MSDARQFRSYDHFFAYYVKQHANPRNRAMHAAGTSLGILAVMVAIATGHYWYALLFFPIGYGFAWTGHFLIERNKPATFGHPWWSFISDFRMLGLMITGRLGSWLERP